MFGVHTIVNTIGIVTLLLRKDTNLASFFKLESIWQVCIPPESTWTMCKEGTDVRKGVDRKHTIILRTYPPFFPTNFFFFGLYNYVFL
jgi:hypothetical protein